uniref:Bromodomain adjacent to zinc finger domain 2B n=1 Tax=Salmo trutta TaxID=8032 RepID=A0A674EVE0_SALTR
MQNVNEAILLILQFYNRIQTQATAPAASLCRFLLPFPGHLFRAAGEQHFNMSTVSSAFPIVNHPAFGLYTTSSGRSEFGGLGSLGMSASLAAHSQLGAFPEWWRAAEAQGRGAAAFFPHLMGLPPMFLPQLQQSHDLSPFQARTPSKNGRATAKGRQKHTHALLPDKLTKKPVEASSNSDSESGSSSDISSEGVNSSDSEDLDEEEDDDDDDDQSNDSDDSDSEKESRVMRTIKVGLLQKHPDEAFLRFLPYPLQPSPQPPALSQSTSLVFQSSRNREEELKQHTSVIQATGLASTKPLALVKPRRVASSSPQPTRPFSSSPKPFSLSSSPKPNSLSSSPKPVSLCSSPKPLSLSSSPNHRLPSPHTNHSNLFLASSLLGAHPKGVIHSKVQDAPMALITKPRSSSQNRSTINNPLLAATSPPFSMPVNLSTGHKEHSSGALGWVSTSPGLAHRAGKSKAQQKALHTGKGISQSQTHLVQSQVELFRGTESDIPSSKDSDDSVEDDEHDDEDDEEDSDDSLSGTGKRRRVTDERKLRTPLEFGWQRETRICNVAGRLQGDVAYYAPCGKKLRQYPDVMKYVSRNGISDITRDHFSFSAKIRVGDFYEAREGPQGLQWSLLTEDEVIPRILAMEGRRGHPPKPEHQRRGDEGPRSRRSKGQLPNVGEADFPGATDAKLLRKLEAQEIARQAAQIKMMRKLQKQAMALAAKEARKQQGEKIKRIQQIQMEKELRAQQILELLCLSSNMKWPVCVELRLCVLCQERERRRQHMMLTKAMDARKKAEERERLKQEKKDEKRLNKERKLELRRLELEIAKELKKPNEDMCLADHKPLPELSRIPGLVLPGSSFSDCLMVMQFLRSFGKVLGFDVDAHIPNLSVLQEGLLNLGDSMGQVQDLLVRMLSAVVCDPGLPPGHRTKTALGDHVSNVVINRDNVSEVLRVYMEAHCGGTEMQTDLGEVTASLKTKAFQAHTATQKASVLAFLVNELSCSKSVVSEIDKNIDHMTNLRRDKWVIEGTLRKLRTSHAKKTGKRDSGVGGEETQSLDTPTPGQKRKRKGGDSEEDEDDDEDSEDQGDEDDDEEEEEEEETGKKGKKVETCEDEDDGDQTSSVEELEKQIDKLTKQQSQIRRKLFESSHSLRSMMFGQDRYKRRYWVLPQCGGVFVEGMESGEGAEELEKERERLRSTELVQVKEEVERRPQERLGASTLEGSCNKNTATPDKHTLNLFLQKPGSFSKLSKLLEVAKMSPDSDNHPHSLSCSLAKVPTTVASPIRPTIQTTLHTEPSTALSPPQQQQLQPNDQLFRVLTEKNCHWFSLLPRSPCDESSVTTSSTTTPPASSPYSSSTTRPKSPSSLSSNSLASTSASPSNPTTGINNFPFSALQVKSGVHMIGLPFCGWPGGMMIPTLPFSASPLPPSTLAAAYHHGEGNGNPFLAVPPGAKHPSALPPVVEVAKTQDYPDPLPIPEGKHEMLSGWWRVADMEELRSLVKALHNRGIRERALQKQIQKHMEYIAQACAKNRDAAVIDESKLEENGVSEETVESWCVEEQAMEMDIAVLQQVEELERKVTSASLQVKGWMYPEPQSEREDLVYHEHKPFTKLLLAGEEQLAGEEAANGGCSLVRRVNNPLDIAVTRLAELERNIERRYLKSPLSTTIQVKLDNVMGTFTVPAPTPCSSVDGEGGEEELAPGMKVWRKAMGEVCSAAQLSLCIQQLQKSIAWERSIMKVQSRAGAAGRGGKKTTEVKRSRKPSSVASGEVSEDDAASTSSSMPKKVSKEPKKRKSPGEGTPATKQSKQDSTPVCVKAAKTATSARDNEKDLTLCRVLLVELEGHQDAWPFLNPVNPKSVPGYKKVIRKPMDFYTIREKLVNSQYLNLETFIIDVNLVFDNCEKFNEDNSDIGRAGHNMRRFFENRWNELLKQTN